MKLRSLSSPLKNLRSLKVALIHPKDQDGEELLAQLGRIGCSTEVYWPHANNLPEDCGLVLLAMRPETLSMAYPWIGMPDAPPIIPIVTSENPITIEAVLQLNAYAPIASPVRSAGLLTSIAVTLSQASSYKARERYIDRLEKKSADQRIIYQATTILMNSRNLAEAEAYQLLRSQSMLKRESIESLAAQIVKAHSTLSF